MGSEIVGVVREEEGAAELDPSVGPGLVEVVAGAVVEVALAAAVESASEEWHSPAVLVQRPEYWGLLKCLLHWGQAS